MLRTFLCRSFQNRESGGKGFHQCPRLRVLDCSGSGDSALASWSPGDVGSFPTPSVAPSQRQLSTKESALRGNLTQWEGLSLEDKSTATLSSGLPLTTKARTKKPDKSVWAEDRPVLRAQSCSAGEQMPVHSTRRAAHADISAPTDRQKKGSTSHEL